MSRSLRLTALGLLILSAGAARADDEPTFRDRPLSAWIAVLTSDPEVKHRQGALIALERIGAAKSNKVLPAVAAALKAADQDEVVRAAAAEAIGRMYDQYKSDGGTIKWDEARDGLAAAVRADKAPAVREAAATSLGRMEGDAAKAVPDLQKALKDDAPSVRAAAADALRRVAVDVDAAKEAAAAVPDLEQLLKDKNADHAGRAAAAAAIGQVGAPAKPPEKKAAEAVAAALAAVGTLADTAADDMAPADVRKAAAEALGRLGEDAGAAAGKLGSVLAAADAPLEARRAAAAALDQFGAGAKPALPALKKAVGDEDRFLRIVAMHVLGRLGPGLGDEAKGVVAVLLPRIDDDTIEVRVAAIQAVAALGRDALGKDLKDAVARLTAASGDSRKEVRDAAGAALAKLAGNP
jgi:HEAT repeat protein